jgi:hypothetical protein
LAYYPSCLSANKFSNLKKSVREAKSVEELHDVCFIVSDVPSGKGKGRLLLMHRTYYVNKPPGFLDGGC